MTVSLAALWVCALNLLFIAALPRVFFRPGRLNAQWWLTAAPFGIAGVGLLVAMAGELGLGAGAPWLAGPVIAALAPSAASVVSAGVVAGAASVASSSAVASGLAIVLTLAAVTCACASIALIAFTLGTHREPVSLWHQHDDAPRSIVSHGAYARIRHPFYAAFLVALLACLLAAPGALTVTALLAAAVRLRRTAMREEARLLRSEFGAEYARYVDGTGRFLPRLGRRPATAPNRGHVGVEREARVRS